MITPSGTLTMLYSFCSQSDCTDGNSPYAGVIPATDGNFYGTTSGGGANGAGTVFKMTPGGTLTTLYGSARKAIARTVNPRGVATPGHRWKLQLQRLRRE